MIHLLSRLELIVVKFMEEMAIYYKIKCRKVKDCVNRKCRYWEWCEHNQKARDKEFILLRIVMLEKRFGLDFSELKEKLRNDTKFEKQI